MSSKNLVICDTDTNYAARLAAFFNEKKELAFQVKICESLEQLQLIRTETAPDILLLNESFLKEKVSLEDVGKLIILSEKAESVQRENRTSVFKYQPGNKLVSQILESCTDDEMEGVWRISKRKQGRVIGVYSPIHRTGQTTFAIEKGRELAKKENVLYLNMEAYAGYGGHFPIEKKKTMSALLYYAKQETGNLGIVLTTLVSQMDGLDYIAPVLCTEDILTISKKEWLWLFQEILRNSIYDVLILDLSECIQGLNDILRFCDTVYVPIADDRIAASKLEQYEQTLRELGYAEVVERMIGCDIRRTITRKNSGKSGLVQRN